MPIENRTARLTILIDPRKKAVFERLCAGDDATPSQVVRRLIREYIERRAGAPLASGHRGGTATRPNRCASSALAHTADGRDSIRSAACQLLAATSRPAATANGHRISAAGCKAGSEAG